MPVDPVRVQEALKRMGPEWVAWIAFGQVPEREMYKRGYKPRLIDLIRPRKAEEPGRGPEKSAG